MITKSERVGVVGLGPMGGGMHGRLKGEGWAVSSFDIDPARSEHHSLQALCAVADILVLSLPDARAVKNVTLGDNGIAANARAGIVVLDTSTGDPDNSRKICDELGARGIDFLDAPVSGGKKGAENGALTMLVGGDETLVSSARPLLDTLATHVVYVGGVGCGQTAKLVNNLLVASSLLAVSEALRLGRDAGVDAETLLAAINASSGRSAVSEINYPRWIQNEAFDSGFSARLMRKDVRAAHELALSRATELDLLERVAEIWSASESQLSDDADFNRIAVDSPASKPSSR